MTIASTHVRKPGAFAFVLLASCLVNSGSAQSAARRTIIVTTTIQAAVDEAQPGDVIWVPPGVYTENVQVSTDGLTIRGSRSAILDGRGASGAIGIRVAPAPPATRLNSFALEGLTIRNFARTGVLVLRTDGYRLEGTRYQDNEEYGPFPIFSTAGVIAFNEVSGARDAGIYIGRSGTAIIHDNLVRDSLSGIQIENSTDIDVSRNVVSANALGIVSLIAPGAPVPTTSDIRIVGNRLIANNRLNALTDPDELLAMLPGGTGVLIVGGEHVLVSDNVVQQHDTAGIAVVQVPALVTSLDSRIQPLPMRISVAGNIVLHSGSEPDPRAAPLPGADLVWDLTGTDNCWRDNIAQTVFPDPLPVCRP